MKIKYTPPKIALLATKIAYQLYYQVEYGSYDWDRVEPLMTKAAAELLRLHAEVERLRAKNNELKDECEVLQEKLDSYCLYGSLS